MNRPATELCSAKLRVSHWGGPKDGAKQVSAHLYQSPDARLLNWQVGKAPSLPIRPFWCRHESQLVVCTKGFWMEMIHPFIPCNCRARSCDICQLIWSKCFNFHQPLWSLRLWGRQGRPYHPTFTNRKMKAQTNSTLPRATQYRKSQARPRIPPSDCHSNPPPSSQSTLLQTLLVCVLFVCVCVCVQLCLTLCHPMDCSPPGSSVHGILQARILEWVAMLSLQGIILTQWSNPSLLHWQVGSLSLVPPGKPFPSLYPTAFLHKCNLSVLTLLPFCFYYLTSCLKHFSIF